MKLEGIHHITAITADAQRNVDFYAGTLGLRMVKKTVNQDAPSVYHLFYADEQGSPGADMTFFEFRGAPPGRAGAGMVHRIGWRVGSAEALDFWAERLAAAGLESRARGRPPALRRPRGPRPRARRRQRLRPAADRRPSRGPGRVRAPGLRRRPRIQRRSRAQPGCSSALEFEPATTAGRHAASDRGGRWSYDEPPAEPGIEGAGTRAPHRLGVADGRPRGLARAGDRGRRPADAGDRPLLVSVDLLPRAERRAVRDRHARPRLRRRRGPRASRREADPAAVPRGSPRRDRGGAGRR